MFGLWFSLIGLLFGTLCSFIAREKNRHCQNWFLAGFVFSFAAILFLLILPAVKPEKQEDEDFISYPQLSNTVSC